MKQLLTIIAFISLTTQGYSQKVWQRLNLDSTEFVKTYGTEQDYAMQESYRISSDRSDGYPVVLVGQKMYWFNQLSVYMQHNGYNQTDVKKVGDELRFYYAQSAAIGRKPSKFTVGIKIGKDDRIGQINITGDIDPLSSMFLGYWGMSGISANELKSKGVITNAFASDRITFDWKGAKPVIKINGGA